MTHEVCTYERGLGKAVRVRTAIDAAFAAKRLANEASAKEESTSANDSQDSTLLQYCSAELIEVLNSEQSQIKSGLLAWPTVSL